MSESDPPDRSGSFLEGLLTPTEVSPEQGAVRADDANLGRRIGPYRLVAKVGQGGMGTVYKAERADGVYDHTVAVKLLKRGMDSEELLRRFDAERRIVAQLDHPYVARIFDGGTTDDGLPFFVMEHVEGRHIDVYCDDRRLSVDERIDLFLKVCEVVAFAHRNLVVHRDLKPANILVTDDGQPKLLDFGIAKVLGEGSHYGPHHTHLGPGPMTPIYASPEQIDGRSTTTAVDIYALGVILYKLLTGRLPFNFNQLGPRRFLEAVRGEDPTRPSVRVRQPETVVHADGREEKVTPERVGEERGTEPRQLTRKLSGDLDTLALRAMHREPERRFASVDELAEDLRRYRGGLPIRSRPDDVLYHAGKFIRRHLWSVAAAFLVLVMILAFAVTMAVQRSRIAEERDRAREVTELLVNILQEPDPYEGPTASDPTVREALGRAMHRLRDDNELADRPDIRGDLLNAVGRVYYSLGDFDQARPLLQEARELREQHLGDSDAELATTLLWLAMLEMDAGNLEAAEEHVLRAIRIRRRLDPGGSLSLARGLGIWTDLLREQSRLDEAEAVGREALEMARRLSPRDDQLLANLLKLLALTETDRQDLDRAVAYSREALDILEEIEDPLSPNLATARFTLAAALVKQSRYDEAEPLLRETVAMRRTTYPEPHWRLARAVGSLGRLLVWKGEIEEGIELLTEAAEIERTVGIEENGQIPRLEMNLAEALSLRGDAAGCEARALAAVEGFEELRDSPRVRTRRAFSRLLLGSCIAARGRVEEGRALLASSYQSLRADPNATAREVAVARSRLEAADADGADGADAEDAEAPP